MEIVVSFYGGALDGTKAFTDSLDAAKVFFDERNREVMLYLRVDELKFAYHLDKSKDLTSRYDETKAFFAGKGPASLRFIDAGEAVE